MNGDGFYSRDELFELGFRRVGANVRVSRKASFHDFAGTVGDHTRIDDFAVLTGAVEIHRYVHVSSFCVVSGAGGPVVLEDCAGLSCRVLVYTAIEEAVAAVPHHPALAERPPRAVGGGVVFGVGCIVGAHSLVLPNARIGDGASIGAFALVDGTIAPGAIAVPRRMSRLRVEGGRDAARLRAVREELPSRRPRGR